MSGNRLYRKINSQLKITFKKALHPVGKILSWASCPGWAGGRLSLEGWGQLKGSLTDIKHFFPHFFLFGMFLRKANPVKCVSLYEIH